MATKTKPKVTGVEVARFIKVEDLLPNPYQPESRRKVSPETAKEFALSFQEHGLIQMPVVRPGKEPGKYEIGDGWLRRAGFLFNLQEFKLQEYAEIPCVVRDLSDQQMADLVMEANTVRKDLNPIELATFYKRYLEDFKISQTELARCHNCSQGEIANTIRLLELPAEIQQEIISQKISPTHGRQLLRMNKAPKLQQDLAKQSISRNFSVAELSNSVERELWNSSKSLNPKSDRWEKPAFDVSECEGCEFKIKASEPWESRKKEDRCLNIECWEKKNSAAVRAWVEEAQKALKGQGAKEKFLTGDEISYSQRETIRPDEIDSPEECEKCPKTALFKYRVTDKEEPERICLDPSCYRKKKTKKTRDTNKLKKEQDRELTIKLGQTFQHANENPRGCLLVLAKHILPTLDAAGRQDLGLMFEDLPKLNNGRLDIDTLIVGLNGKSLEKLLNLTIAAQFTRGRRASAYHDYSVVLKHEQQRDLAIITGTLEAFIAEVTAFQEANCRGCIHAKENLIGTGEECCNYTYHKQLDSAGKCRGRCEPAAEEVEDNELEDEEEIIEPAAEEEKPIVYISDDQLSAYTGAKNPLAAFQNANCPGCYFAIKERVGTGEPCCIADDVIKVEKGICQTRRSSQDKD